MRKADEVISMLGQQQHGVVARWQLLAEGVGSGAVDRRIANGLLRVAHPGVYRLAGAAEDDEARLMGAVLLGGPRAVASHRSAARLHAFDAPRFRPEVVTDEDHPVVRAGIVVHRTMALPAADRASVRGIPTTTPARTLLDLGAVLPFELVEQAAQDALIRKLVTPPDLVAVLDRVGKRGRPGTAVLRAIVHQSIPDERLESELERRLLDLIRRSGLPTPVLQHEVCFGTASARLDFAWPTEMVAVEADGRRWHASARATTRDMARRRQLQALGWTIHPYGWSDVVDRPAAVAAELTALRTRLASRSQAYRPA